MTLGGLVAFNAYLAYLSYPTIALGWILAVWQRGVAAWVRVRDLLASEPAIADVARRRRRARPNDDGRSRRGAALSADGAGPAVRIQHLSLTRQQRTILDDVSLRHPRRAARWPSWARPAGGKTTLADAVPRLWTCHAERCSWAVATCMTCRWRRCVR